MVGLPKAKPTSKESSFGDHESTERTVASHGQVHQDSGEVPTRSTLSEPVTSYRRKSPLSSPRTPSNSKSFRRSVTIDDCTTVLPTKSSDAKAGRRAVTIDDIIVGVSPGVVDVTKPEAVTRPKRRSVSEEAISSGQDARLAAGQATNLPARDIMFQDKIEARARRSVRILADDNADEFEDRDNLNDAAKSDVSDGEEPSFHGDVSDEDLGHLVASHLRKKQGLDHDDLPFATAKFFAKFLLSNKLFRKLGVNARKQATAMLELVELEPGRHTFGHGTNLDGYFLILEGILKLKDPHPLVSKAMIQLRAINPKRNDANMFAEGDCVAGGGVLADLMRCREHSLRNMPKEHQVFTDATSHVRLASLSPANLTLILSGYKERIQLYLTSTAILTSTVVSLRTQRDCETIMDLLKLEPTFSKLPIRALETVAQHIRWQEFRRGEVLCREGKRPRHLYMVLRGIVSSWHMCFIESLWKKTVGHSRTTNSLAPSGSSETVERKVWDNCGKDQCVCVDITRAGEVVRIGELAFAHDRPCCDATIVAENDLQVLSLPSSVYVQCMYQHRFWELCNEAPAFYLERFPFKCRARGCCPQLITDSALCRKSVLNALPQWLQQKLLARSYVLYLNKGDCIDESSSHRDSCVTVLRGVVSLQCREDNSPITKKSRKTPFPQDLKAKFWPDVKTADYGRRYSAVTDGVDEADRPDEQDSDEEKSDLSSNEALVQSLQANKAAKEFKSGAVLQQYLFHSRKKSGLHWSDDEILHADTYCELLGLRGVDFHEVVQHKILEAVDLVKRSLTPKELTHIVSVAKSTTVGQRSPEELNALFDLWKLYDEFAWLSEALRKDICQYFYFEDVPLDKAVCAAAKPFGIGSSYPQRICIVVHGELAIYASGLGADRKLVSVPCWGCAGELRACDKVAACPVDDYQYVQGVVKATEKSEILCLDLEQVLRLMVQASALVEFEGDDAVINFLLNKAPQDRTDSEVEAIERIVCVGSFWETFNKDVRMKACRAMTSVVFGIREPAFWQGDQGDRCFFILKGSCGIYVQSKKKVKAPSADKKLSSSVFLTEAEEDAKEEEHAACKSDLSAIDPASGGPRDAVLVRVLGQGECFGETALLREAPRSATAVSREHTECAVLLSSDFNSILRNALAEEKRQMMKFLQEHLPRLPPRQHVVARTSENREMKTLANFFAKQDVFGGAIILKAGKPASHLFLIRSGRFQVTAEIPGSGRCAQQFAELGVGQILGASSLVLGFPVERYTVTCACERAELYRLESFDVTARLSTELRAGITAAELERNARIEARIHAWKLLSERMRERRSRDFLAPQPQWDSSCLLPRHAADAVKNSRLFELMQAKFGDFRYDEDDIANRSAASVASAPEFVLVCHSYLPLPQFVWAGCAIESVEDVPPRQGAKMTVEGQAGKEASPKQNVLAESSRGQCRTSIACQVADFEDRKRRPLSAPSMPRGRVNPSLSKVSKKPQTRARKFSPLNISTAFCSKATSGLIDEVRKQMPHLTHDWRELVQTSSIESLDQDSSCKHYRHDSYDDSHGGCSSHPSTPRRFLMTPAKSAASRATKPQHATSPLHTTLLTPPARRATPSKEVGIVGDSEHLLSPQLATKPHAVGGGTDGIHTPVVTLMGGKQDDGDSSDEESATVCFGPGVYQAAASKLQSSHQDLVKYTEVLTPQKMPGSLRSRRITPVTGSSRVPTPISCLASRMAVGSVCFQPAELQEVCGALPHCSVAKAQARRGFQHQIVVEEPSPITVFAPSTPHRGKPSPLSNRQTRGIPVPNHLEKYGPIYLESTQAARAPCYASQVPDNASRTCLSRRRIGQVAKFCGQSSLAQALTRHTEDVRTQVPWQVERKLREAVGRPLLKMRCAE